MSGKVIITTPFPTPEQVAAYYKIPAKRVAELRQMMDDIRADEASKEDRKRSASRNDSPATRSKRGRSDNR